MKKNWLYLVLGLALILNSSNAIRAQEEEGGWWDISSETDVTIDEQLETQSTATEGSSSEDTQKTEGSETEEKEQEKEVMTYTVVPGDTLSSIALRYLGSASRYPEIVALNPELISDPNLIMSGWNLKIQLDGAVTADVGGSDAAPDVKTSDESSSSSEVAEEENELTNAEKIAKLQEYLESGNAKLPNGCGLVDFTDDSVKFLVENGICTKEELNALCPEEGYTWKINNGKIELVDAKNVALTSSEIELLDERNALIKQAEEFTSSTSTSTLIENSLRQQEVNRKLNQRNKDDKKDTKVDYNTSTGELIALSQQKANQNKTNTTSTTEKKPGKFESAGQKLGKWVDERAEHAKQTAVPTIQNIGDVLKTAGEIYSLPVRAGINGLISMGKGALFGGEGNGLINGVKNTIVDTFNDVKGLPARCQERTNSAVGGTTTHTSSSGNTHGGSGSAGHSGGGHRF